MAIKNAPRSVSDATRFTPTTPHASSKPSEARPTAPSESRFSRPSAAPGRAAGTPGIPGDGGSLGGPSTPPPFGETPEQRVARLRAAHVAAKKSQVSRFDQIISGGRRFFDSAHKLTVLGLLGFTAIAGLVTVYTAADMIMYNRKRKAEFIEAQQRMAADSLEAARLAYMTGKATEEQIALVEEANTHAEGGRAGILGAPSILGAPRPVADAGAQDGSAAADKSGRGDETQQQQQQQSRQGGLRGWLFSNLKREEEGDEPGSSQRRLGFESMSEEDAQSGLRDSDLARALEDKQAYIREKARSAFDKERENQRKGGALDRVGVEGGEAAPAEVPKKKGWLW